MAEAKRPLKVFLCHAHSDQTAVLSLYTRLTQDGVEAWLDKEKLLPGHDWEYEIRQAVREADVVIVCLSKQFNQAGFRQKEVRIALNEADMKPEGDIFIIPARFEECSVPQSLQRWQWVDLFEDDGYIRLINALRVRAEKIGLVELPVTKKVINLNTLSLKILVTGGREASSLAETAAYFVGMQVIIRGHVFYSNGASGVDKSAAEGALKACRDKSLSPDKFIQVYRPRDSRIPRFDFGQVHIVGQTYSQRKNYVVDNADVVIIIGGGAGTKKVANRTLIMGKPLIPLGVGNTTETAFDFWQKMFTGVMDSTIPLEEFRKIGPRHDVTTVAVNAVILAENLVLRQKNNHVSN
jgi:predicted Rossmann-fold nucleotide-binding protein